MITIKRYATASVLPKYALDKAITLRKQGQRERETSKRNLHYLNAHCQAYEQFLGLIETWENMGTAEMQNR